MAGRVGELGLAAGVLAALAAALLWLQVGLFGRPPRAARLATYASLGAAAVACLSLEWALLRHDFGVRYVAENGGRNVPVFYTVTSLWAALEGSLLLWLLILTGYGALLARSAPGRATTGRAWPGRTESGRTGSGRTGAGHPAALRPWAMTVHSVVAVFFFALAYFGGNPFRPVHPVPADGPGPNPLLQVHPAMGLHPPVLYAGYIGLVIPFGYAVAALLTGRTGAGWLRAARPWLVVSWTLLTAGIVLGAWWSYAVLGWGGYWAWDPVENASLLPWLTATALLHVALAQRRGGTPRLWGVALACASFLLVLVGTFLTRSGMAASVHAFSASLLGPMLFGFVILTTAVVAGLIGWRAEGPRPPERTAVLSRETTLLGNGVLLVTLAAVVLTGTVFPLVTEALTGTRTVVGPPYFDRTAVPVILAVLVLMAVAPLVRWGRDAAAALGRRLAAPATGALATVAVAGLASRPGAAVLVAFGAAAFVLISAGQGATAMVRAGRLTRRGLFQHRRRYAGILAHAGLAIAAIGVAGSSGYTEVVERQVSVGGTVTVGGATAQLSALGTGAGGDNTATARLALTWHGDRVGVLRPGLRSYPARDMTVGVPAIRTLLTGDIYATLTGVSDDGADATIRLAVNPLVPLVWVGGAIVALGGLLALGHRRRHPAPRSRRPAPRPGRRTAGLRDQPELARTTSGPV